MIQERTEGDVNLGEERKNWLTSRTEETLEIVKQDSDIYFHQSMSTPCMDVIEKSEGCYIYNKQGDKILDFHGNSVHQIGHANQSLINDLKLQLDELTFIPRRYTSDIAILAANSLNQKTDSKDYRVLFTPSGTAAISLALKIVRKVTRKFKTISFWGAFHGASLDAIAIGGDPGFCKDLGPLHAGAIRSIPYNGYRSVFGEASSNTLENKTLDYLEYIIAHESDIGAIILEPIRATDIHIASQHYFKRLRSICDRHQIILIFDEIPTCLGRTGYFYTHQYMGIEPDIIVLGKGLGGGIIPQAAVLVKDFLNKAQDVSMGHYTHEKSALGCRAIVSTLKYIDEHNLLSYVQGLGSWLDEELDKLMQKHLIIGDIRRAGLLIAIELVLDRNTKKPAEALAEKIMYDCLAHGLSFKVGSGNILILQPPLVVTKEQLCIAFSILDQAISKAGR